MQELFNATAISSKTEKFLSLGYFLLFLNDLENLALNANKRFNHELALEEVKLVVFHLEFGRVTFNVEKPRPARPIDLEPKLQQVTELGQVHIFVQ